MASQFYNHENDDDCIEDMLRKILRAQHRAEKGCNNNGVDTIPFMLYCKGNCEPFEAMGDEFCTIFFKVCKLGKKCVTLELLRPDDCYGCCRKFPNLCASGECLTFNVDCFCGIQCRKPIRTNKFEGCGNDCSLEYL